MVCYLSSSCFSDTYISDAINDCHKLNPYHIELSAPHYFQTLDFLKKKLETLSSSGFKLLIHNYFPPPEESFVLNMATKNQKAKNQSINLIYNALELCVVSKSPLYGIHAGYLSQPISTSDGVFKFTGKPMSYSEALNQSIEFVNNINGEFEKVGVKLVIENLFPSRDKNESLFCSFEQIKEFMSQVPKSVGLLLDLGHLNISSKIMNFELNSFIDLYLDEYADRLFEIHLSENNGYKDEHLEIKKNSWQLMALKLIHQQKPSNFENRFYCIESRNASANNLKISIDLVNEIIL